MADLFISYSRKDIAYARLLHEALKENDLETWIDWQDIPPSTEWLKEVYTAIEGANTFIFILSSSSALSEICSQEIDHARKNNKRIIPIVINDVEPSKIHPALAAINWIFSRSKDELQPAIANLIEAIQTDYDWVKAHTRLQVRALEWERAKQDKSFLLQGTDLQQAENWLTEAPDKEPKPTLAQTHYIQSSRQAAIKRQRSLLLSVGAALIVTLVLGVVALINGQRATQNARLAHIRELTAVSQLPSTRFDIAMLLGVEAFNTIDNFQTRGNLLRLAQLNPEVERLVVSSDCPTTSVAFSPDGELLAAGNLCNEVLLWNADAGQLIPFKSLREHSSQVLTVAFSPDGKLFASGSENEIILWDATNWQILTSISGKGGVIKSVAFSPNGETLAYLAHFGVEDHNSVFLWNVASNQLIGEPLQGLDGYRGKIIFSPDGKAMIIGYNKIIMWDVESGQTIVERTPLDFDVIAMALSPDGKKLATGSENEIGDGIYLWDTVGIQPLGEQLGNYSGSVSALAFSPDGKILAVGSFDNTISRWDLETMQPIGDPLIVHSGRVQDIAYSPDGQFLVSASDDGSIIQWNFGVIGSPEHIMPDLAEQSIDGAFSPDGKLLAVAGEDAVVRIWDIEKGQLIGEPLIGHTNMPVKFAFNPDNTILASMSVDGSTFLWDILDGRTISGPFFGPAGSAEYAYSYEYSSILFSPDGNYLVFGKHGVDSEISLWNLSGGKQVSNPFEQHFRWLTSLAFSPDGKILASGGEGGIMLWDISTGLPIGDRFGDHPTWVSSVVFSPDGKTLASAGGGIIRFLDASSRKPVGNELPAFSDKIRRLIFSPDGKLLVSVSQENSIVLWDVLNQQPFGDPLQLHAPILSAVFSMDRQTFLLFLEDGSLVSLDTDVEAWRSSLCEKVGRNFTQREWAFYFPGEAYRKTCEQWPVGDE